MNSPLHTFAQKYWRTAKTAQLYLEDEEQTFLVCSTIYYLISNEDVWQDVVARIRNETAKQLDAVFEHYLIRENKNSKSIDRWLEETSIWDNWFAPLLSQPSKFPSLSLEEVYLFPACYVLLRKTKVDKESFQILTMEDKYASNALHIVKELVERIASHLRAVEMCIFWKLNIFVQLLCNLICYQNSETSNSLIAPLLQTLPLSDLRLFLFKKKATNEWNKFLETYQVPIAKAPKFRQYSFIKLTLSYFHDLVSSLTTASSEKFAKKEQQLENLCSFLLWFYFAFQSSTMGLHLAIFVICYSDTKYTDSIAPWKCCLQSLKELLMYSNETCTILVGRCWQLCFVILIRILELVRKRREERPPSPLEVSFRLLISTHLDFWKNLTGIHCCFPDISYFHALLNHHPCIVPPSSCYPSMMSYLLSIFTICKAELVYKMYSALDMHIERIETERSFVFCVTHLEQSKILNRQRDKEHFQFSYTGRVHFLASASDSSCIRSFGRLGALFTYHGKDKLLNSTYPLHLDDIQWIGLCYSIRWIEERKASQNCTLKFSISFVSNDQIDLVENDGHSMCLICLEAANDIHQQVLQELYSWNTMSIANFYEDQRKGIIPEFFSNILTQESLSASEKEALGLIVKDETHQSICLHPFITNAQELMSSLSHVAASFQIEADENFRSRVYLRKFDETFLNISCCFVACNKNNTSDESSYVHLYEAQKAALCASWLQRLVLIRGPPGTGKTEVASCIVQFLLQNRFIDKKMEHGNISSSVLIVIAQSNEAADHLAKKVIQRCYPKECRYPGIDLLSCRCVTMLHPLLQPILRLGRQSNDEDTRKLTLEGHYYKVKDFREKLWKHLSEFAKQYRQCQSSEDDNLLSNLCHAIEEYEKQPTLLSKYLDQVAVSWLEATTQKYSNRQEMERGPHWKRIAFLRDCALLRKCDSLLQSYGQRFSDYFEELLSHCQLVITTFASLVKYAEFWPFNGLIKVAAAVVEEAALVTEWNQFILFGKYQPIRTILIGDDLQLAPIVQYRSTSNDILDQLSANRVSLFTRLIHSNFPFIQLQEQGRAAPCVADLYRFRYQTKSNQNIKRLNDIHPDNHFWMPDGMCDRVLFLNIPTPSTKDFPSDSSCYENIMEAKAIAIFLHYLHYWNVPWNRIAVLTPYRKQKKLLQKTLQNYFEKIISIEETPSIFTTDEFQGKEKDVILISLVLKSSSLTSHLRDERRINVLTSRARCGIYLFGNYAVFYKYPEWKRVMDQIYSSDSCVAAASPNSGLIPLCTKSQGSSSTCAWKRKDVFSLLQEWLKEQQGENQKVSLEQLFSQWKI